MAAKTNWAAIDRLDGSLDGVFDGVEVTALQAVLAVESLGDGFLSNGRPKILFEGHQFYRALKKQGIDPNTHMAGNADIIYRRWTKKHYKGGSAEYGRLARAVAINETAALESASFGIAQVMGFNHRLCGYNTVQAFVEAMNDHDKQVMAFLSYLKKTGIWKHIRAKKWHTVARMYNGPGYRKNRYASKLARAYRAANYDPQAEFPNLMKSKTIQGGLVTGGGIGAVLLEVGSGVQSVSPELVSDAVSASLSDQPVLINPELIDTVQTVASYALDAQLHQTLGYAGLAALVAVAGIAYVLYARFSDRLTGVK